METENDPTSVDVLIILSIVYNNFLDVPMTSQFNSNLVVVNVRKCGKASKFDSIFAIWVQAQYCTREELGVALNRGV